MSDKYNQIMEQVEVTEEMRQRILGNLEGVSCSAKTVPFSKKNWDERALPLAACFVLILGLLFFLPARKDSPASLPQVTNPITQAQSLQALSQLVGFDVAEIPGLPFDVQTITYAAYYNEIAETTYLGTENTCILRQAAGTDDISGDYTDYPFQEQCTVNGTEVLLKGQSTDSLQLAVWHRDDFSYSMRFTQGIPLAAYEAVLASVLE